MRKLNFAVFILTHGRPFNQKTIKTLKRFGYTGEIYLIVDDEDKTLEDYKKTYENVIVFNKDEVAQTFDMCDNFDKKDTILYARNASFKIAEKLGIKYFLQLDDDYTDFSYRFDDSISYVTGRGYIKNLDVIFKILLEYYKSIPAKSIAISQNGDWIGGKDSSWAQHLDLKRKCMNSFMCSTKRPFKFTGRMNDDVNTYIINGSRGDLFFTIPNVSLKQTDTQTSKGGLTEMYLENGTYIKSFYTVMIAPSCAKVGVLTTERARLHHKITWRNAVPVIMDAKYKK